MNTDCYGLYESCALIWLEACFYRPPTKLQECNIFGRVCHSVQGWGTMWSLCIIHWHLPYRVPLITLAPVPLYRDSPPPDTHVRTSSTNLDLTVQGFPRTCSDLFIMKRVRLASRQMVSYWNAFLFLPSLSLSLPKGELLTFSNYRQCLLLF